MDQLPDQYLDLKSLSEYSSLAVSTLRDYLKDVHPIPHYKAKGKILVKRSEFDAWIECRFRVRESKLNEVVDRVMASLENQESAQ